MSFQYLSEDQRARYRRFLTDPSPEDLERRELAGVHVDQGREYRLDDFGPDSGLIAGRSGAVLWHGRKLRGADMTGRWFCLMARPGFGTWAAEPGPGCDDPCPVVDIPSLSPHRGGGGERERGVHLGYA